MTTKDSWVDLLNTLIDTNLWINWMMDKWGPYPFIWDRRWRKRRILLITVIGGRPYHFSFSLYCTFHESCHKPRVIYESHTNGNISEEWEPLRYLSPGIRSVILVFSYRRKSSQTGPLKIHHPTPTPSINYDVSTQNGNDKRQKRNTFECSIQGFESSVYVENKEL